LERKLKKLLPDGVFKDVSPTRSRTMGAIKGKHTKSTERKLRMILVRAKIKGWKLHASNLPGKPDFYFPEHKLVVFVDGCFWHGCPRCGHIPKTNSPFWAAKLKRNTERDRKYKKLLKELGLNVIRIWEHSLKDIHEIETTLKKISRALARTNKAD
jgi:DNA mismatch endonuclease (patch repair protein)